MRVWKDDETGKWRFDVTIGGRRVRESGFASRAKAEEFIVWLKNEQRLGKFGLGGERRRRVLMSELGAAWLDEIEGRPAKAERRIVTSFLEAIDASSPDLSVEELRTAHVADWLRRLRRTGLGRGPLSNRSCNRYLSAVSAMLSAAPSLFVELEDWRRPRLPWQKDTRRGRERVISAEERSELLDHLRFPRGRVDGKKLGAKDVMARRDVADCFELMLLTGMRGIEVRELRWSEVDLVEREIRLPDTRTKTRTPRPVLLNARAVEILERRRKLAEGGTVVSGAPRHAGSRWVFPNERGDGPRREISRVIRPLAQFLGLSYGSHTEDGFSPHATRHTATTEMLRAGYDLKTVQDVIGHSDRVMSLRYAHSTVASRRAAVEHLNRMGHKGTRQKLDKRK